MNFIGFIFLLAAHYICGRGSLKLFRIQLRPVLAFCLSMIVGVAIISLVPCVLQLMHISIDVMAVTIGIAVAAALCAIPLFKGLKAPSFPKVSIPLFYEWPFLAVCLVFMLISIWHCFYFPPYARDMLSGPELLAEYTVREKTMLNSVFSIELSSTNNYFKSPFITGLQIVYKLLVCPFGEVWLSVLFVSFMGMLYSLVRERIHGLLASFLLLLFLVIPDLFAYTHVILYDYSNMIFFFCGFYFMLRYMASDKFTELAYAAFLFGLATYIRTETLILVAMLLPVPAYHFYKQKLSMKATGAGMSIFLGVPALFYILCADVFVRNFIPIPFDLQGQINPNLTDITSFFHRIADMNTRLIFSKVGVEVYGYFIFLFCGVLLTDVIFFRRFNKEARILLYGIAVVYIGMAVIGYLLPLADLMNTTKRGLFKALPLMLLYIANSASLQKLSAGISKWEYTKVGKGSKA